MRERRIFVKRAINAYLSPPFYCFYVKNKATDTISVAVFLLILLNKPLSFVDKVFVSAVAIAYAFGYTGKRSGRNFRFFHNLVVGFAL